MLIFTKEFSTRKEMTLTMCRLSEFYEGKSKIKGKYFSFDKFLDVYSDARGNLDSFVYGKEKLGYFAYWEGFNLPKESVDKFRKLFTKDLTEREKHILNLFQKSKALYLITYVKGDMETLRHEMAHALFSVDAKYQKEILNLLKILPSKTKEKMEAGLKKMSYAKNVYLDEMQAYLIAFDKEEMRNCFHLELKHFPIKAEVDNLFEKHLSLNLKRV